MANLTMPALVQRFRWGAYLWFALVVLSTGGPQMPGSLYFLLVPSVFAACPRRQKRLRQIEDFLTPAVTALLAMPELTVAAVCGALITGRVAERGLRTLPVCAVAAGAGALAGAVASPLKVVSGSVLVGLGSVTFVVGLSISLVALGYTRVMGERQDRRAVQARAGELQQHIDGLRHYVSPGAAVRVAAAPLDVVFQERRWLTVAFVDLVDFTRLTTTLAPEQLNAILSDFLRLVADATDRGGGSVEKFLGDGVLVSFAGTDRRVAAKAALTVLQRVVRQMAALSGAWRREGLTQSLCVHCALASGYCTMGDFGAKRRDFTVIGPPVNLASRLMDHVPAGEIWAAEETVSLLDAGPAAEPAGSRRLKGLPNPVRVYRLNGNLPGAARGGAVDGGVAAH